MIDYKPAGFWIRFLAALVDGLISFALTLVIALILNDQEFFNNINRNTTDSTSESIVNLLYPVIFIIFFTASKYKGSPGKMICRIQVLNVDGSQISLWKSVGRYFAYFISAITLLIGFMMAGWNEEKKALHDMICDTRVVYRK
ncbi:RDD family protein [Virgibacillus phasianinus]|uniref:RDD family protein n=1 Tax=Virgibacillus phasianinus TaxID=2017483 RepID=A0A220TYT0_9BACI|nr:RDD family protein [Virgibacillus phasianinus]ASK60962.1 RDD family protein [Virgibacillus phasianinus]